MTDEDRRNVVLIGMPAAGKSTVGVLVAKNAGLTFIDTDLLIQSADGRSLRCIIEDEGRDVFRRLEEQQILELDVRGALISTGGSVVYSDVAVEHLRRLGVVVFLDASLEEIRSRIGELDARGLVRGSSQTLDDLYAERRPLYLRACDVVVDCRGRTQSQVAEAVLEAVAGADRDT